MSDKSPSVPTPTDGDAYQVDTVVTRVAERKRLATEKRVVRPRDASSIAKERAARKLEDATRDLRKTADQK